MNKVIKTIIVGILAVVVAVLSKDDEVWKNMK